MGYLVPVGMLQQLDEREKNGYLRITTPIEFKSEDLQEDDQVRGWASTQPSAGTPRGVAKETGTPKTPSTCPSVTNREQDVAQGKFETKIPNPLSHIPPPTSTTTMGLMYVGCTEGPHSAFLGPAAAQDMARQIAFAEGPSGKNPEYLYRLAAALRRLGACETVENHVFDLEVRVRQMEQQVNGE
eukprot:Selendium_serpulae@DN3857_c0_g1_i1.p1